MADKKISALTASTTPLAGTEVLPIVQGGATVKVAVSNLTAGRAVSALSYAATNNVQGSSLSAVGDAGVNLGRANLQNTGAGGKNWLLGDGIGTSNGTFALYNLTDFVATLRVTSTGDVSLPVGNLVIGTAGKGIDFSATSGTGTSELLADYEEGTWTPVVAAGVGSLTSYTIQTGDYTKVGNIVTATFKFTITNNGTGSAFLTMTLPFTSANESMGTTRENTLGSQGNVRTSGASSFILTYNGLYPVATGSVVTGTVTFKV